MNTVRVSPRIERRRGGALVDRGVALVDAPGAAERVRRGARGRDARVRVRWARGRVTRTLIRRPAPRSRPHGVHAPGFTRAREPGDAHGRHRLPRRARHRSDADRVRCVCAPRFWEAPIFSRDVGVQRESSAERYARGLTATSRPRAHFTGRYSRGRPMEGATKICMRCKQELENNQTNYPHGSSWCIECAPPDSDSD